MTQVVSVSASTAALAIEALRPQTKAPAPASIAAREARKIAERREGQDEEPAAAVSVISSTEVALDLLTLGHRQPQAGMKQAIESYEESI
ncbi:hypothetical protein [Rhizobium sp. BK251]|uniref:hypothetical protein n=1 Tax=Rhizobium sp. BK251 TaxID=2512125 RepID=UPI00104F223C|nr:hypothetical protein [Rhizobium sp. BK251]TCL73613.1 hypothetical protein EV286_103144 [Rhizobium sp. BK251]